MRWVAQSRELLLGRNPNKVVGKNRMSLLVRMDSKILWTQDVKAIGLNLFDSILGIGTTFKRNHSLRTLLKTQNLLMISSGGR